MPSLRSYTRVDVQTAARRPTAAILTIVLLIAVAGSDLLIAGF